MNLQRQGDEPLIQPSLGPLVGLLQKWGSWVLGAIGLKQSISGLHGADQGQQLLGVALLVIGLALAMTRSLWNPAGRLRALMKAKSREERSSHMAAWLADDAGSYIGAVGGAGGAIYGWETGGLFTALVGLVLGLVTGVVLGLLVAGIGYFFTRIL